VAGHTAGCADCRAFEADTEAFTALLRSAPPEPVPWPPAVSFARPRRRFHARAVAQVASVASVVVAAFTLVVVPDPPSGVSESVLVTTGAPPLLSDDSIRSLRRDALAEGTLQILPVASTAPAAPVKPALPPVG
jgi:hypothetical protein